MNSASVGFQCPSCLKEGARSTRTGRLPYGGLHSADPRLTSFVLIGINVVVWVLIRTVGSASDLASRLSLSPRGFCESTGGNFIFPDALKADCTGAHHWIPGVATGAPWQVITSAFAHVEPLHIGLNMLALYFLGPPLEQILGRARFLAVYLVSAIAGSAAVMLFADPYSSSLGASGAIFGLMGALVIVVMKVKGDMRSILMWIGINLVFSFTFSGISWQAHIGGLIGGVVLAGAIVYAPKERRTWIQWGSVVAVSAIAIALILVKAHTLGGPPAS
ncbi:MAG: rhomboid family intrarane serine protease [Marmoricola sp.]|nr:rhomboid family intrarane serine protease [Marmoricola sp.]